MSDPKPVVAVSVCLFRQDEVLLILRSRPPFAHLWSLPGGRVEFGETLEDAARRELREETGAVAGDIPFVRIHEAIDAANGAHAVICVFRGLQPHDAAAPVAAADDAADARFFPLSDVRDMQAAGRTTTGLCAVIDAAHRAGEA